MPTRSDPPPGQVAGRIRVVRESREPSREEPGGVTGHSARRTERIERGDPDANPDDPLLTAHALDVLPADPVAD
ncbi:hypothetical protein ACIA6T_13305 [Streptomyces sp. NPDC051740]|uniref:hypothetical protein n=1 Tax=Streptomyces sp. NPDC051740 TaxID=3365673 RepID=UPI0037909C97